MGVDITAQLWYGVKRGSSSLSEALGRAEEEDKEFVVGGINITEIWDYDSVVGVGAIVLYSGYGEINIVDPSELQNDMMTTKTVVDRVFEEHMVEGEPKFYLSALYR